VKPNRRVSPFRKAFVIRNDRGEDLLSAWILYGDMNSRAGFIHRIETPDDPGKFHTHPATAFRLILRGGYVEEMEDGTLREWRPGMFGIVRPETCHRIDRLLDGPSWSLWLRGERTHEIHIKRKARSPQNAGRAEGRDTRTS
jgi:hypothetical protein